MDKVIGVLIDTVSIQHYVFGSNHLKENLGASYLVDDIYCANLKETLNEIIPELKIDEAYLNSWKNEPKKLLIKQYPFEVGFIGGGNAFLLFREKEKAISFIREWTKRLLVEAPGINTAVAVGDIDLENFDNSKARLFAELEKHKSEEVQRTVLPSHGITAECSRSGYTMDIWNSSVPDEKVDYMSSFTYAKHVAAKKSNESIKLEYRDILKNKYCFTDQMDNLGQKKEEDNYIAIVHIDGNDMGERFIQAKSLEQIRTLSYRIEEATKNAFRKVIETVVSDTLIEELYFRNKHKTADKNEEIPLPIRPIVLGGDDVTFVCDGKLGIYLATVFMEEFEKQTISSGDKLSSCAGIAVVKTKYPFYRGYQLSEALCSNAKKKRRDVKDKGSWLDYQLMTSKMTGNLEGIRQQHFNTSQGSLIFRPYKLQSTEEYGLITLIDNTRELLIGEQALPSSKIYKLRSILYKDQSSIETFIEELKSRDRRLPVYPGKDFHRSLYGDSTLHEDTRTPYYDMIELINIYPFADVLGGAQ